LMETAAFGTTAPDGSVTVPESVAPTAWAYTGANRSRPNTRLTNAKKLAATFVKRTLQNTMASNVDAFTTVPNKYGPRQIGMAHWLDQTDPRMPIL
jgi:hypothetical protein